MVFSQFKFTANLAQLVVPKMHCLYANAVVQPSVQHCPCYLAWKTKVHTWCRHCHLCINAPKKDGRKDFLTLPRIWVFDFWCSQYTFKEMLINSTIKVSHRLRSPVRKAFTYGSQKVMLHWITIKYAVSRMKMPYIRYCSLSVLCAVGHKNILETLRFFVFERTKHQPRAICAVI